MRRTNKKLNKIRKHLRLPSESEMWGISVHRKQEIPRNFVKFRVTWNSAQLLGLGTIPCSRDGMYRNENTYQTPCRRNFVDTYSVELGGKRWYVVGYGRWDLIRRGTPVLSLHVLQAASYLSPPPTRITHIPPLLLGVFCFYVIGGNITRILIVNL